MGNNKYFDEEELLRQLISGDEKVWQRFYNDIREPFRAYFLKSSHISPEEALELFHKVMIIFHRKVVSGGLVPPLNSKLKTYIFGVGKNVSRQQGFKGIGNDEIPEIPIDPIVEQTAETEENARQVQNLLQKIGNPCRDLLDLFYIKGYSMEAVAITMDFPSPGAAKKKKFDCLKAIRKMMNQPVT